MTEQKSDEKELLEILEMVKAFEQKAREMCEISTANTKKWRLRTEDKRDAAQKLEV
ncbi:hypothetical protein [Argonema galeatum]|uniref:hypothetical protein n=1 Tax=Argonema galeatum TaxID=2942762 RepID=UPI0020126749|nr:hypothetical protein [Argonema galeatum]MCL1467188.1 hypothetical protein [Argonema galeatum A003/A1]